MMRTLQSLFFLTALATRAHPAEPANPPAQVENPISEDKLPRVILTEKAHERLGIRTVPVEKRSLHPRRLYPGLVIAAPGARSLVTAPFTGRVRLPGADARPSPGRSVVKGQTLASLQAMIPPDRIMLTPSEHLRVEELKFNLAQNRADTLAAEKQAEIESETATQAFDRARALLADRATSQRAVEEAEARAGTAKATLEAARTKNKLLEKIELKLPTISDVGPSLDLEAPQAGIIQDMPVADGQVVMAGAMLFEVIDADRPWVRVAVHPSELKEILVDSGASVESPSPDGATALFPASAVKNPPAVTSLTESVDFHYQLTSAGSGLRPGQRTGVWIDVREPEGMLCVPSSALVRDIHGTAWIYVETGTLTFERRGVEVLFLDGDLAAVVPGRLEEGTLVVSTGVAELFGTEFQFGK